MRHHSHEKLREHLGIKGGSVNDMDRLEMKESANRDHPAGIERVARIFGVTAKELLHETKPVVGPDQAIAPPLMHPPAHPRKSPRARE